MPELYGDRVGDKRNEGEKEAIKRSVLERGREEQLAVAFCSSSQR